MTKIGPKEQRLREMKAAGTLPKHAEMMLDDGAPAELIRLEEAEPKRAKPTKARRLAARLHYCDKKATNYDVVAGGAE